MILDRLDVAAIRLCENHGIVPPAGVLADAELTADDFRARLRRLSEARVIRTFRATLAVPPLLGGDWVWASVLATAARPLGIANLMTRKLPFVTESILNVGLPPGIGPNLALLFYSRDFDTEARFIRSIPDIEHSEVCRVADYSFPVSRSLSTDEKRLLREMAASPAAGLAELGVRVERSQEWIRAKLDQLLWTQTNRSGVMRVLPELDWTRAENFGHCHFVLKTGHRPDQIAEIVAERGFELVLDGRTYEDRYIQVEADCWGIADVAERASYLDRLSGVGVHGILLNQSVLVNSGWVAGLLA